MYIIVSRSCVALAAFVQTGTRPSSWHRACLLWLMIHWNPTAGVGLRHAMGAKYESFSVIGHRIRRVACCADLDASLQGDDLDGPGMCSGTPRWTNRSLSRSRTSSLVSLLATSIARHSRVNSSMTASRQHPDRAAIGRSIRD